MNKNQDAKNTVRINNPFQISETGAKTIQPQKKRINMAFTDQNYRYIIEQSRLIGVNYTHFINSIILLIDKKELNLYVQNQPLRTGNNATRKNGHRVNRININFRPEVYHIISEGSKNTGTTITQFTNMIIEFYKINHS